MESVRYRMSLEKEMSSSLSDCRSDETCVSSCPRETIGIVEELRNTTCSLAVITGGATVSSTPHERASRIVLNAISSMRVSVFFVLFCVGFTEWW